LKLFIVIKIIKILYKESVKLSRINL